MPQTERGWKTRLSIIAAARELLVAGAEPPSAGAVARRAGVARLTVYQHFGSHRGLFEALAKSAAPPPALGAMTLREAVRAVCERWASDAALFRRLPAAASRDELSRDLAGRLAAEDRLRPGCSLREAEDVIGVVTSFAAFDRLHQDGRRSTAVVADMLTRMAGSILNAPA